MQQSAKSGKLLQVQQSLDQVEKHLKEALSMTQDSKLKDKLSQAAQAVQEMQM